MAKASLIGLITHGPELQHSAKGEPYDYADVQIDRNGNLSCNLLKVVPV